MRGSVDRPGGAVRGFAAYFSVLKGRRRFAGVGDASPTYQLSRDAKLGGCGSVLSHPSRKNKSAARMGHPSVVMGEDRERQMQVLRLVGCADSLRMTVES